MKNILFLILISIFTNSFAQSIVLNGRVIDSKTEEGIPFTNVIIAGTSTGATTDFDGNFTLKSDKNTILVKVSAIGYKAFEKKYTKSDDKVLIKLKPETVQIKTVEVKRKRGVLKRDTTALLVFANVVKNKSKNRLSNFDYYEFNAYTKTQFDIFNFDVEKTKNNSIFKGLEVAFNFIDTNERGQIFLPILLKERVSDVYFKREPLSQKEKINSEKYSGILSENFLTLIDYNTKTYDVYNDIIPIAGKSFYGPFSTAGKLSYHYTMGDTNVIDNKTYYQLYFVGKTRADQAFKGFAWIESETWGIKEIELKIGDKVNINWVNDFYFYQSFTMLDNQKWFIDNEISRQAIGFSKKDDDFSIRITTNTSRKDIVINKERKDKFYAGDPVEILIANEENDEEYWQTVRHDSLSAGEQSIYTMVDTVKNTSKFKVITWLSNFATTAYVPTGPIEFGRFYKFVSWNSVEGTRFRLGIRTNKSMSKNFRLSGHIAYSTKDKEIKYGINYFMHLPRVNNKWHSWEIGYQDDYTRVGVSNPLLSYDNFINSLLTTGSIDLFRIKQFNTTYKREWIQGFQTDLSFNHKIYSATPGQFDFIKTDVNNVSKTIKNITSSEFGIKLRYAPKEQYFENYYTRFPISSKKPILTFWYTLGVKNVLLSQFDFHKFKLNLKHRLISLIGYTKYQVEAGAIIGKVPFTLLEIHSGNETFLYNKKRYNLMNEFEFASDLYGSLWLDHHFDGFLLNKIPLINRMELRLLLTSKILFTKISNRNKGIEAVLNLPINKEGKKILSANPNDFIYAEVGFGIENIFRMARVDFVWRVTQRDKPGVQKWGVRIAFQPKF